MVAHHTDVNRREMLKTAGGAAGMLTLGGGVFAWALFSQTSSPGPPVRGNYLTCVEVKKLMSAYNQNELKPDLMANVAAHLNKCGRCYDLNHQIRNSGGQHV